MSAVVSLNLYHKRISLSNIARTQVQSQRFHEEQRQRERERIARRKLERERMEKDRIAQRQARERERLERRRLKELERIQKLERSRGFSSRTIIIPLFPPSSSLPNALNTHTGTMFDADQPKSYGLIKSTFHTQSLKHYHNTTTPQHQIRAKHWNPNQNRNP